MDFDFAPHHEPRPWTLRIPGETSAELVQRRMAHEGIFFRIDKDENNEHRIFTDHNARCPYVSSSTVRQLAEAGMTDSESGRPQCRVFRVAQQSVAPATGLNVAGTTVAYSCKATLAARLRPYVTAFPPKRELPVLIGARTESQNPHAQLFKVGRYRLRQLFKVGGHPHAPPQALASVPIRKQSHHDVHRSPRGKSVS